MMIKKFLTKSIFGLFLGLNALNAFADNQVVLIDGAVRVFLDRSQNQLKCVGCGSAEEIKARAVLPIRGEIPLLGSYSLNYFAERGLIILRTDLASNSCPSGKFSAIDLETRIAKALPISSCQEPTISYFNKNGKVSVTFVQGKKMTRYTF